MYIHTPPLVCKIEIPWFALHTIRTRRQILAGMVQISLGFEIWLRNSVKAKLGENSMRPIMTPGMKPGVKPGIKPGIKPNIKPSKMSYIRQKPDIKPGIKPGIKPYETRY